MKLIDAKITYRPEETTEDGAFRRSRYEGVALEITCEIPTHQKGCREVVTWKHFVRSVPESPFALCDALKMAAEEMQEMMMPKQLELEEKD